MAKTEIQKIQKELSKELDAKRYEHTLGVAYTASCMAMRYGYDLKKAYIAGLLHDCAKGMTHEARLNYCKKYDLEVTDVEKKNPSLLHAKVGADMCLRKYGIEEEEIASAVRYHTTGKPDMSLLEKIIFIADYVEPHRKEIPGLDEAREILFCDLDETLRTILKHNLQYLEESDKVIDSLTRQTYEYYTKQE